MVNSLISTLKYRLLTMTVRNLKKMFSFPGKNEYHRIFSPNPVTFNDNKHIIDVITLFEQNRSTKSIKL